MRAKRFRLLVSAVSRESYKLQSPTGYGVHADAIASCTNLVANDIPLRFNARLCSPPINLSSALCLAHSKDSIQRTSEYFSAVSFRPGVRIPYLYKLALGSPFTLQSNIKAPAVLS